jgi:8-oxo-dGTP diphosphatase
MKPFLHVAVGVVYNALGEVLLTQRPLHKHQGGKWEFAGGKVEAGESVQEALIREFDEELGLVPTRLQRLISLPFEYPEHQVLLDTWEILDYQGEPESREGQAFRWVNPLHLDPNEFPPANRALIRAVQLPHYYLITPDEPMPLADFRLNLQRLFALGIRLCRVRQGSLSDDLYHARVHAALELGGQSGVKIIIDGPPRPIWAPVAGWHLNSQDLYHYHERPVSEDVLLIASLHNPEDIVQANKIQVDCSVLSPVKPTLSHPGALTLGWERFETLAHQAAHPVYALGGLTLDDLLPARQHGAQGIAAIRALWELKERVV